MDLHYGAARPVSARGEPRGRASTEHSQGQQAVAAEICNRDAGDGLVADAYKISACIVVSSPPLVFCTISGRKKVVTRHSQFQTTRELILEAPLPGLFCAHRFDVNHSVASGL
jgi:hypothetical protein